MEVWIEVFDERPDNVDRGRAQGIEGYLYMALIASSIRSLGIRHRILGRCWPVLGGEGKESPWCRCRCYAIPRDGGEGQMERRLGGRLRSPSPHGTFPFRPRVTAGLANDACRFVERAAPSSAKDDKHEAILSSRPIAKPVRKAYPHNPMFKVRLKHYYDFGQLLDSLHDHSAISSTVAQFCVSTRARL